MARLGSTLHWLRILREIDLRRIRREAEAPMQLRLAGEPRAVRLLTALLSPTPGAPEAAPALVVAPDALPEGPAARARTVTVLSVPGGDTTPEQRRQIERWRSSGWPLVLAVLDDERYATTEAEAEGGRVFLPAMPGAKAVSERLAPAILEAVDDENERTALGRSLPVLREAAVERLIEEASRANALYSATTGLAEFLPALVIPLTAADLIVLTKNQLVMAYRIALVAGKQGRPADVLGEMLSVVGGGLFFRQVARELVGLVPVLGWLPKVAIAYAGTRVIGLTVRRWAIEGEVVGVGEMARLREEAVRAGRAVALALRDRLDGDEEDDGSRVLAASDSTSAANVAEGADVLAEVRRATEGPPAAGDPIPMPDGDGRDVFPQGGGRAG